MTNKKDQSKNKEKKKKKKKLWQIINDYGCRKTKSNRGAAGR